MIVGLVGYIGSGKGTVANLLVNSYNFRQDSFAASLKDACACLFDWPRHLLEGDTRESREWREMIDGWWAEKLRIPNFSPRLALQLMGTDVLREHFNQNLWFLTLHNRIRKNPQQNVVVSDVRFPNEISFIQENGGFLVKINRGQTPEWYDTAILANKGSNTERDIMVDKYSHVHFSEWAWAGAKMDYEIENNGTIESLQDQVDKIINKIRI